MAAQVALGSVSILLRGLQQLELLRDESQASLDGTRTGSAPLARHWHGWQKLELGSDMAWGAGCLLIAGWLLTTGVLYPLYCCFTGRGDAPATAGA
jgi:hypothetical protein